MYLLDRPEDVPPRLTSRLNLRIAIVGAVIVAALATILLRLWSLQVLDGEHYRALAKDHGILDVRVRPPRGEITDRNGKVLVDNRTVMTLQLRPSDLPKDRGERHQELERLGDLLGLSLRDIRRRVRATPQYAGYPVVLRQGLDRQLLFYLLENSERFPGVSVERTYARQYKQGDLAAHILGIVGQVSPKQLKLPRYRGVRPGDIVGQSGVEYTYDRFLRGIAGGQRIQVDALGRPRGVLGSRPTQAGDSLRLTLDAGLQEVGEQALQAKGLPGAFVAMNVHTGAILAMGSYPTYDPSFYTRPHSKSQYDAFGSRPGDPLVNRADQGGYPTGSAFKPITATAALEDGLISPGTIFNDTGSLDIGGLVVHNAGGAANGPIDMSTALQVSSDVYFFSLGLHATASGNHGQIQDWARKYGLGEKPNIDLPAASAGLIPTPAWRNRVYRSHKNPYIDRPWNQGDNVNLAVGQGDVMVTPLQLARAYSALANGGTLVRPHVGGRVVDLHGKTVERIKPPPKRHLNISDETRNVILGGLERAAMEPGGTSFPVMGGFPFAVAGKTGTAERGEGQEDQSWYSVIAPYRDPQIAVAVTVEHGGFGVESAAPIARAILERYFQLSAGGASGAAAASAGGVE
ncbi:MAG TPA: penicillin-binding protein 2 [Solirubrobacterales bacterium]|nr:penicillin-binding protein 2 [Solirubrobacterales bacterium]